jgi:hypothetical protein
MFVSHSAKDYLGREANTDVHADDAQTKMANRN